MMLKPLTTPVLLALIFLVMVVVVCAMVLSLQGDQIPSWFESVAILTAGGVLGAYPGSGGGTPAP
jgi:hypothetical protein